MEEESSGGEVGGSTRRGSAYKRDWTKGSILRNLLSLSWPMMISESLYLVTIVDMIWAGRLGVASIAGVGIAGIVVFLIMSGWMGIAMGARAMIARFWGAGDVEGAAHIARQAFVVSATYGVVMTIIGIFLAKPILSLFGVEADVIAEGVAYLRIFSLAWVPISFWYMAYYIMQFSGDTLTPLRVELFIRSVHLVLCPLLIFGWWIFPRMGVSGAATSNVIVECLGMCLGLWVLFTGRTRLRLTLRNFRLDPNIIWRMLKISIPACVMSVQGSFSSLVLMWIIAPFGTLAVAAHSMVQRVHMILYLPVFGLGTGAGVLVGQNLGAGQPERAERSGWTAVGLVEGFAVICSVVILIWAEKIVGIFSTEPGLVEVASTFMRIAVAGFLVLGFAGVLQNCISGAGDTLPTMLVSLVTMWVVQLPLAFFLPRVTNLGMYGVRWAMVAGIAVGAVALTTYFRLGRWKRKKI